MNDKQKQIADNIVLFWGEGRALAERFSQKVKEIQNGGFSDDELCDTVVSVVQRLVPDDEEREHLLDTVLEAAEKLSPDLPFGKTILKAITKAKAPRLTVVES